MPIFMELRIRRFNKEKEYLPEIEINDTYENMQLKHGLTITLPSNYPFMPPILKVNNIQYLYYLQHEFKEVKPFLDDYNIIPYKCWLCCNSITVNWTPCFGVKDILDEYNNYIQILYLIHKTQLFLRNSNMDGLIHSTIIGYLF